jgi:hypothetical protein
MIPPCQNPGESNKGSHNAGNNDGSFDGHDELLLMTREYLPSAARHIDLHQGPQSKRFRARLLILLKANRRN